MNHKIVGIGLKTGVLIDENRDSYVLTNDYLGFLFPFFSTPYRVVVFGYINRGWLTMRRW